MVKKTLSRQKPKITYVLHASSCRSSRGKPRGITPNPSKMQEKPCFREGKSRTNMFFRRKTKENHEKLCFPRGKIKDETMFFRRKTKENHAKSVQNVRKLLFSLGKTKEKQKTCFFVGKPRKITPKSVQNVRKLLFS